MSKDTAFQTRTLGVAIIGSGLMAKAHTMAWRNVQAVYADQGSKVDFTEPNVSHGKYLDPVS